MEERIQSLEKQVQDLTFQLQELKSIVQKREKFFPDISIPKSKRRQQKKTEREKFISAMLRKSFSK